jgi:hypothetical protein
VEACNDWTHFGTAADAESFIYRAARFPISLSIRFLSLGFELHFSVVHTYRFELCPQPLRQSLTFRPSGGSTFGLWPLFLLRDEKTRTEMTGTQHVGASKHKFLHFLTIKMVHVILYYKNNFNLNFCYFNFCYLVATSTGSKSQFFQRWREWE